jgi:hypothetical protein
MLAVYLLGLTLYIMPGQCVVDYIGNDGYNFFIVKSHPMGKEREAKEIARIEVLQMCFDKNVICKPYKTKCYSDG